MPGRCLSALPKLMEANHAPQPIAPDLPDLTERVEDAVVRIDSSAGSVGSGFLVENDVTVVTNWHVVFDAKDVKVTFKDGTVSHVQGLIAATAGKDIAVLRIVPTQKSHKPLVLAATLPRSGERVATFGVPEGLSFSASDGIVSAVRSGSDLSKSLGADVYHRTLGFDAGVTWIQTTAPISHGNSGGPLVNMQGKVVGVNTLLQPHGQNLGFAVSAGDVSAVLHLPFVPMALLQQTPTTQSRFVSSAAAIKRIRRFAIIVDTLTPDAVAGGLREGDVRGLVENRLHNAGIKITEPRGKVGGRVL